MLKKMNKNYVSEVDQFLTEFDKKNPQKSASQLKEQKEYARIGELRDKKSVTGRKD
jgi:hypothetical protein